MQIGSFSLSMFLEAVPTNTLVEVALSSPQSHLGKLCLDLFIRYGLSYIVHNIFVVF
jgi:hypothetical protein